MESWTGIREIPLERFSVPHPTLISNNSSFESIIFKGVTIGYDLQKMNKFITNSKISDKLSNNEILVSRLTADKLDIEKGDDIILYFQTSNNQKIPNVRSYFVKHIFDSDFPDFDKNVGVFDLRLHNTVLKSCF